MTGCRFYWFPLFSGQAPVLYVFLLFSHFFVFSSIWIRFQMAQVIDVDTPKSAYTRKGFDGFDYEIVFSDEFNTPGRTFYPGLLSSFILLVLYLCDFSMSFSFFPRFHDNFQPSSLWGFFSHRLHTSSHHAWLLTAVVRHSSLPSLPPYLCLAIFGLLPVFSATCLSGGNSFHFFLCLSHNPITPSIASVPPF